jgi:hypothetical protein
MLMPDTTNIHSPRPVPLSPSGGSFNSISPGTSAPLLPKDASGSPVSLSVNYLPSKFSDTLLIPGARRRKGKSGVNAMMPKRGGGVEAFRSGEARIPGQNDDDYDGVSGGLWGGKNGGKTQPRLRWNRFKWTLFIANIFLTIYSLLCLVFCLLTLFNVWHNADVVRVGNRPELIISTIAASLGIITALIGWAGILLNNRSFLAVYTFLLWICFAFLVTPGYITYRRKTFNLEGKINAQWSRFLGQTGRLRVQNRLGCCGYFSPFIEATVSQTCYARSTLRGCKKPYLDFQRLVLRRWYSVAFGIVPLHLAIMVAGLLCSNHVTYRFGKGMMPKAYRLSLNSMAVIMDNYANQLADQYGTDVASEILARSRSNLHLDRMTPYSPSPTSSHFQIPGHNKYDSLNANTRAPEGAS